VRQLRSAHAMPAFTTLVTMRPSVCSCCKLHHPETCVCCEPQRACCLRRRTSTCPSTRRWTSPTWSSSSSCSPSSPVSSLPSALRGATTTGAFATYGGHSWRVEPACSSVAVCAKGPGLRAAAAAAALTSAMRSSIPAENASCRLNIRALRSRLRDDELIYTSASRGWTVSIAIGIGDEIVPLL